MSYSNFPQGVTSFGIPILGSATIPSTTGNYWFVSSLSGSDGNLGNESTKPKATLQGAINASTASNGDVIILMPGHVETLTSAAAVNVSKSGLYIVALGVGTARATFTFATSTAASFDITATNCALDNLLFTNAVDGQLAMVRVLAADCDLVNCELITNTATTGAVIGILAGTTGSVATRFRAENCQFRGPATNTGSTTTAQIDLESGGVDYIIRHNWFEGKATQSITNGTTVLTGLIDDNRFIVYTGTKGINMQAASTPFITNNNFNVPSGTNPIVAAAGFVARNSYSAAAGVTAGTASTF